MLGSDSMALTSGGFLWLLCSIYLVYLHHPRSAEASARCVPGVQFACADGTQCIPSPWRCDRDPDCRDVSDEENCTYTGVSCQTGFFQCASSEAQICLPESFRCDGQIDCQDHSDEGPDCPVPPPFACPPSMPYQCLDGNSCIAYSSICDFVPDCDDWSDEGAFCNPENGGDCTRMQCGDDQVCQETINGGMCICPIGYQVNQSNSTICEDINECDIYGTCDQICKNIPGSYSCSCAGGYKEFSEGRCQSDEDAKLLVANVDNLLQLNIDGSSINKTSLLAAMGTRAMDYNLKKNKVCWVNFGNHAEQLKCADLTKMDNIEVKDLILDLSNVQQIALDWVTGNIYLMDEVVDAIIVCRFAGDICITVVDGDLSRPKGLTLDPKKGFMFYTDWGTVARDKPAKIERANMDGSGRLNLNITKIVFPHGITADYAAQRIYFADTQLEMVQTARYDGTGQRIIAQGSRVSYLYGMTLFENHIYATKWQTNATIISIDKFTGEVTELSTVTHRAGSIHAVHPERQPTPINQPCRKNNGGCEHLCLVASDSSSTCRCQQGYNVLENGTCIRNADNAKFLLFGQGYPGSVRGIPVNESRDPNYESMVPILNLQSPRAVDFYAAEDYVYYADSTNYTIGRQKLNGTHREDLLNDYITNCEGIAVDWISKNLYWTDDGSKTISVARLDGSRRRLLLKENFTHPRAIVVDPVDGYMYWSDWSEGVGQKARIERAFMDGRNRTVFVNEYLQWPNGLSLDKDRGVLYWCDAFHDRISRKFLNGTGDGTVTIRPQPELNHPFGITHYKDILFWSEYRTGFIYRYDTTMETPTPVSLRKGGLVFELKLYDANAQKGTNACSVKNGGCEHLCLPVPDGKVCQCENGKKLINGTQCIEDPDYVRYSRCTKASDEFECNNGRCIEHTWLCDGDNDCGDNTDETHGGCYNQTCGPNKFQCPNNKCIPMRWTCDGDYDCGDSRDSDETHELCSGHIPEKTCDPDVFKCDNGRCISTSWHCDQEDDCGDNSDEKDCKYCREGLFECANGACISITWRCDRDDDCGDGSDEVDCAYSCDNETQFQCHVSLRCINIDLVCDGVQNCEDASDEREKCSFHPVVCNMHEFQCDEQRCIPETWKCDGEEDCINGTDEYNCTNPAVPVCREETHYKCPNENKCIPDAWQCDGIADCQDQSDEVNCQLLRCEVNQWQCENHTMCLPLHNLCDGAQQCIGGTDELDCDLSMCDKAACKEECQVIPGKGVMCYCPEGKVIDPEDSTRCILDTKMCTKRGRCSQQCINGKGTYVCKCYPGYQMASDGWTCKSNATANPYLIFSNRNQLRRVNLATSEYNVLVFNLHNSIAVDFHYSNSSIYWTDVVDDKIYRGWLDENSPNAGLRNIEPVIEAGLATCEGLAVDWIGGNLYWVESHLDQIEVARLDGAMRTTVVASNMESPRAIALDPTEGLMFWTDWENRAPRIERASMSGANRSIIVNITQLEGGWPNGLTIDYSEKRIYWIDARSDAIHAALYNGSNIFTVLKGHNSLYHPFAITVFEGRVFWTDWRSNTVYQANKFTGQNVTAIQKTSTQPFDIHVYHPYRQQQKPNPCGIKNGGCSDLCLLNGHGIACACPHLKKLHTDNKTCINDTVFFVISRPTDIRGVDVDDGYYNVIPALTIPNVANASSIDHDTIENRIYWTDLQRKSINRAFINGTDIETVIEGIPYAYNLAIDWVSRNMYWTNLSPDKSTINIARLDGSFQNEIDNLNLTNPKSIVIEPTVGIMYWINAGPIPSIEKARMDGTNQTSIVTGHVLNNPTGLAIDRSKQRLYWTDAGLFKIKTSNLEGGNIQDFLSLDEASQPSAITVTPDKVFWADNNDLGTIKYVHKNDSDHINILRRKTPGVTEMFMYNPTSQIGENACKDQNGGCQQLCLPLPGNDRKCACTAGYVTSADSTTCNGKNNDKKCACTAGYVTSADSITCNGKNNDRKCACTAGYVTSPDSTTCNGVSEFLLYSTDETIRGISLEHPLDDKDMLTPITGHMLSVAIDFHAAENFIYWIDTALYTLNRIKRDHTERQVLLTATNSRIEGIAVDWIAGNMYWTDQRNDVIEVSRTNGSFRYVLISEGIDKPRPIVVHPVRGYLIWADWGVEPKIERSLLNGENRTVIINSSKINWPNGLVIDFNTDMLYWCDAGHNNIARVDLNGGNYKVILSDAAHINDPFAITMSHQYLYFTDRTSGSGSIYRLNKDGNDTVVTMKGGIGVAVKDVHVYSTNRQPGSDMNPCSINNGNCSQICFYLGGTRRTCACAHGTVANDGLSCEEYDAYILYSERNGVKSINLYNTSDKNQPIQPLSDAENIRNVIGLAVDYMEKRIFYTDIQLGNIQVVNVNGTGRRTIVAGIGSAEGIAYDPLMRQIYWTSYTNSSIGRLIIDEPTKEEVLVRLTAGDHPRGIALDYCHSLMFWTNWNEAFPRIQRSSTSGQNVTNIITDQIQMPNGIGIDHKSRLLFWSDAKQDKIERCDYDGQNRVVLLITEPVHPFGLAVFDDYLYWTDWVRRAVLRADKYTAAEVTVLRANIPQQPMGIVVMAADANNCFQWPCLHDNGGCEDTCQTNVTGHVLCSCPEGKRVEDGSRCIDLITNCQVGDFTCSDGTCTRYEDTCDGKNQCSDGSDEDPRYCSHRFCRENYIRCNNGQCVSANRRCDGKDDCNDNSDELNCGCKENQFMCKSGECIALSSKCDHRLDCQDDGSDEDKQECPEVDCAEWGNEMFLLLPNGTTFVNCPNFSVCIFHSWICDGVNDCGDGSDEKNCSSDSPTRAPCEEGQFQCRNGRCIQQSWVCDRENDCGDNFDEEQDECSSTCPADQNQCANGQCIPKLWVCDRDNDCGDNSDENEAIHTCSNHTCTGDMFRCTNQRRCISRSWVCDGDNDCGDAQDEHSSLGCNVTRCKDGEFACANGRCIQQSWACDHDDDCGDGSDEPKDSCDFPACLEDEHRCSDGRCLPKDWVCDGDKDCHDGSDETICNVSPSPLNNCTKHHLFQCDNGKCIPQSARCNTSDECGDNSDEVDCRCDIDYPCSQRCVDLNAHFWCYCVEGFKLLDDQVTCALEADQPKPYLLFSNRYQLRTVGVDGSNYTTLQVNVTNAVALDYDWEERMIYWSDVTLQNSKISRANITHGTTEVLHDLGVLNPDGIAVDWAGRNLYWCDKGLNVIEVSRLNGSYRKTIIKENLDEPRAIALDITRGVMFWTDWGDAPYIGRASLDGRYFTRLVTEKIQWPNALTVDYTTDRVYWGDAREDRIESVSWNGTNRHTVVGSDVPHIFAMSMFGDYIYWTDWDQRRVKRAHKFTGQDQLDLVLVVHRPMDIQVLHPLRQPRIENNPCGKNNGGCSNLCLLNQDGGRTCACPNNFYVASDGMTCVSNCTGSQFVCRNDKCIPSWWHCDQEDDCGDRSDEPSTCRPFYCIPGQFQCENTSESDAECINPAFICDGEEDCRDGSDEFHCLNHSCLQNQIKCESSNICIPKSFQCDGIKHCAQGEDEETCGQVQCRDDQFQCNSTGRCIPDVWRCDGEDDCEDQSDEMGTCRNLSCPVNEFACHGNGRCIPQRWQCDGERDCADGSDEKPQDCSNRSCPGDLFRCKNYNCIPSLWRCDGDDDCGDNSDEDGCNSSCDQEASFRCEDGICITKNLTCDGKPDCGDGSDEQESLCKPDCAKNEFQCKDGRCIWIRWNCDGDPDCNDQSDEEDCENVSCHEDEFHCDNNKCKPLMWRCDGEDDCGDSSDEDPELCARLACPVTKFRCSNHICVNHRFVCDGINTCGDNSDESFCTPTEPPLCTANQFKCKNHRCIDVNLLCNGVDNCQDRSDELDCTKNPSCHSGDIQCAHRCSLVGGVHYCTCHAGYELLPDGVSCGDVNECRQFGICSQTCENLNGSYDCSCVAGYKPLRINGKIYCEALGGPPVLYIAEEGTLHHMNTSGASSPYQTDSSVDLGTRIISMDMHYSQKKVFILSGHNSTGYRLYQAPLNSAARKKRQADENSMFELFELDQPEGVAVDWINDMIYWTDSSVHTVEVSNLNGSLRRTLISNTRGHPQSIVVHPKKGLIFFTNWGRRPGINRAHMDGSHVERIVEDNLAQPTSIAIDYVSDRLYWADSKVRLIESSNMDGGDRVPVVTFPQSGGSPFSIDIFEDLIYGSTKNPYRVFRVDKFGNQSTDRKSLTYLTQPRPMTSMVKLVHHLKQDTGIANPCVNKSCHHDSNQLCLLKPNNGTCVCKEGFQPNGSSGCSPVQDNSPCAGHVCANNGNCVEVNGRAKCRCPVPYSGALCELNRCRSRCQHNGTCTYESSGMFYCDCTPRWKGSFCNEDRCRNYCSGHGECYENGDTLACRCNHPWTGEQCNADICLSYCHNGGVCSLDVNGRPQCLCPKEFPGTQCDGDDCHAFCSQGSTCQQIGTTIQCICSSARYTGERCAEDRCDACAKLNQSCVVLTDGIDCRDHPDGHPISDSQSPQVAVAAVVPILIILLILVIIVLIYLKRRQRSTSGFAHRRIESEEDMEFGNPTFKYSRQVNEEEEGADGMDAPFTVRDHKARTNFTNPVYNSYLNQRGSELSLENKKFVDLPQRDTERLLQNDDDDDD
eukprot:XP_011680980.1 PREDICTED: low-density lipoprotein receptor-related protein 1 isoform X3 [Strongylocentrotus purpuratus]